MHNYVLVIQYDGTKYRGWQILGDSELTIQGKLTATLSKMVGYPVEIIGSGRTDAGVHAIGQVANFHLKEAVDDETVFLKELNSYLPEDIAVLSLLKADDRFHARFSAISKTYRYRIGVSSVSNVFERKYIYKYCNAELDVERMKRAASLLIGEHDFKSFCGNKHMKKSTVRTVTDISVEPVCSERGEIEEIVIEYTGDGFLQNMIRIITGTLIEIGSGSREISDMSVILESLDRSKAGFTAPAQGLTLVKVEY